MLASSFLFLLAAGPQAQVGVDAGPDVAVFFPGEVQLLGEVSGVSPIAFWLADGNLESENRIITYHEDEGTTLIGPLRDSSGTKFGWPSDLLRIEGRVYGVETGLKSFYRIIDETKGIILPIGRTWGYEWVTCMAYDFRLDILYAIDAKSDRLFTLDRQTGRRKEIGQRLPFDSVKGIAYHERSGLLYGYDQATDQIITIDPSRKAKSEAVMQLHLPRGHYIDELDDYRGEIYGSMLWKTGDGVRKNGQVKHIDLYTGILSNVGPEFPDVSAHSLMVVSMPERVQWSRLEGPGQVFFRDRSAPDTTARFSEPGKYVLQLKVVGKDARGIDTVRVDVRETP